MDTLITATPAMVESITNSAAQAAAVMVQSAEQGDGTGIVMAGFVVLFLTMIAFCVWAIKRTSGEAERTRTIYSEQQKATQEIYKEQQALISQVISANTEAIERLENTMARSSEPQIRAVEKMDNSIGEKLASLEKKVAELRCNERMAS
jgi:Na+-transporting methylmalonyl-CoA/oxaloacetate decarboxylase gamma subunit